MSAPLDIASYSTFVYALAERHPFVTHPTLTLAPIGAPQRCRLSRHNCWHIADGSLLHRRREGLK